MMNKYSLRSIVFIVISLVLSYLSHKGFTAGTISGYVALVFPSITLYLLIRPLFPPSFGSIAEAVYVDDHIIRRIDSNTEEVIEEITWDDLSSIFIRTTSGGPFFEDLYWVLSNKDETSGVAIGNGVDGFEKLLDKITVLPGVDNDMIIKAMGCTSDNVFDIWSRDSIA